MSYFQGDKIGRIFAYWAIYFFGDIFENYRRSPNFLATFFQQKKLCTNFEKKIVGLRFGDFFTNSFAHTSHFPHRNNSCHSGQR
jgi:hypothetical protein